MLPNNRLYVCDVVTDVLDEARINLQRIRRGRTLFDLYSDDDMRDAAMVGGLQPRAVQQGCSPVQPRATSPASAAIHCIT